MSVFSVRKRRLIVIAAVLAALAALWPVGVFGGHSAWPVPLSASTPAPSTPLSRLLPDLAVLDVQAEGGEPGQVRVLVRYRNIGPAAAAPFESRFEVDGREAARAPAVESLPPGEERTLTVPLKLTYGIVRFVLDDTNWVRETDETNNDGLVQVFGKPPGLAVPLDDGATRRAPLLRDLLSPPDHQ